MKGHAEMIIDVEFRRSRFSAHTNCVEVRRDSDAVRVRDSKDVQGNQLVFPRDSWGQFIDAVKCDAFAVVTNS
jgi:hypothetical protein